MITLKKLSNNDIFPFYIWINDDEAIKYSLPLFLEISTKEEIDKWYNNLLSMKNIVNFGIFLESTDELIGYAGICDISETNRSGEFYIFIGEKRMWGKGVGTLVAEEILNIGFSEVNLNRIFLTVSEPNIGGVKAYQKAGYKLEGQLRQACFRDNEYHDKLVMSVLKSEWERTK